MHNIAQTFTLLKEKGRKALMPYVTLGYPALTSALDIVPALAEAGADLVELGVPFSDPLADGATIQAAAQRALENGMSLALCLEQAAALRARGVTIPFVLMGYYNPIMQFGIEHFVEQAVAAGIDGLIVPDLPPEEAGDLYTAATARGLDVIFLLAPTSDAARVQTVAARSGGFIYLVSLVGVTGARESLPPDLAEFVARVRAVTEKPLAVGFGIATPEQAAQVARLADGVIVGSALVKVIGAADHPAEAARTFVAALRMGIDIQSCKDSMD
ncbi:MAG TPA: tryptophan synthase subunit alpha [Anaerolineae bacterium]|nr:tryptophan synthase subunit alpha [Anaerolineae bacterium]HQK13617.1 tryptophan synthase subunit alpha [Anaerolineae bacterium]